LGAVAGEGSSPPDPKVAFLSHAASLAGSTQPGAARMIFNDRLDAGLALFFMAIVVVIILASAREWYLVMAGRKRPQVHEAPYVESRLATSEG
jgi:carbon starvation protein